MGSKASVAPPDAGADITVTCPHCGSGSCYEDVIRCRTTGRILGGTPPSPGAEGRRVDPLEYHDVSIALSKARAARCLVRIAADEDSAPSLPTRYEGDREEIVEWIQSFAFAALDDALDEIEAGYRKAQGAKAKVA